MKAALFDSKGTKKGEIELPKLFETEIREDLVWKVYEAEKEVQPYAPFEEAGKRHSASGTISHRRHEWKGHYGKGMSRIPRKAMWRRGTQFFWIGAEVSGTRGGRRAHPPKLFHSEKKINKKERLLALNSALAATVNKEYISARYASLDKTEHLPAVIESMPSKTKDFVSALKNMYAENYLKMLKTKAARAGKGNLRGRKSKSNAGILIVVAPTEKANFKGVDIRTTKNLAITDLYPLGRASIFTKKAIEALAGENKK